MKFSILFASSSAMLAMAGPLNKRVMETELVIEYVTVTVTEGVTPAATETPNEVSPADSKPSTELGPSFIPDSKPESFPPKEPKPTPAPNPLSEPESETEPEPTIVTITPDPAPKEPQPQPAPKEPEPRPAPKEPEPEPTTSTPSTGDTFKDTALAAHNLHRANHSAPAMTWNNQIAQYAQSVSDLCVFEHNRSFGDGEYGQNLAMEGSSEDVSGDDTSIYIKRVVTNMWYNGELNLYDAFGSEPNMQNLAGWGHFTQVVWKGSTELGCGITYCPKGSKMSTDFNSWFSVCHYKAVGNVMTQFATNVLPALGGNIVTA